jgi:SWI/SNF-related matrix-associated actin-dependent regulator 1 of chromatin subfamily A
LEHLKEKKVLYDTLHGIEKQKMNAEIKNNIHTLNRLVATSKVNSLKLIIEQLIEEGEKVVVFCSYKDPINQLEALFPRNSVKIDGSVASHKRQELINRFIDDDDCNVFLGNMAAAGIGINLVNAKYVFMMNFPFTPDKITQAQKRLHRPGQKSTVHVGYTIAKGTIDEHILDIMSEKAVDIDNLIDSESDTNIDYGSLPMMLFRKLLEN